MSLVDKIQEYLESTQPYEITCNCGNTLNCEISVDGDLDICLKVEPCDTCIEDRAIRIKELEDDVDRALRIKELEDEVDSLKHTVDILENDHFTPM